MPQPPTAPAPPDQEPTTATASPTASAVSILTVLATVIGLAVWVPRWLGDTLSGADQTPREALADVAWPAVLALGVPGVVLIAWGVAMLRARRHGRRLTALPVIVAAMCLAPGVLLLPDLANAAADAARAASSSNTDFPTAEETLDEERRLLESLRDDLPIQGAEIELALYTSDCVRADGKEGEQTLSEIVGAAADDPTSLVATTSELLEREAFTVDVFTTGQDAKVVATDDRPERRIDRVDAFIGPNASYVQVEGACVLPGG